MAKQDRGSAKPVTFQVSTAQRPDFKQPLAAYLFNANGELVHRAEVRAGKFDAPVAPGERARLLIAPAEPGVDVKALNADQLKRLGAYEPALHVGGRLITGIEIPGPIIDIWPFCFCWVHGTVVRDSDGRVVCNARVHICEVDRVPIWIWKLRDPDIFRLRDDLLEVLRNPPLPPVPPPGPGPDPGPFMRSAARSALRFAGAAGELNPQPLPPKETALRGLGEAPLASLGIEQLSRLRSTSPVVVRNALIENWKLLIPWFCYWPHWWWLFRCDEMAVLTTDAFGRFDTTIFYRCGGDHPDLYFWVEYDFGGGFETVHRPRIACNTYWNFACGTEITIRITDPRVPGCDQNPDLTGLQVVVMSIGRNVAVREIQTSGKEGVTLGGEPFGGRLEPRVDFSRTNLINAGVPYYRWSYRRLTGPDGTTASADSGSVPIGSTVALTETVTKHYKDGTSFPAEVLGPMPTSSAPAPNLFRICPPLPPVGNEWVVVDERVDLATGYFDTAALPGNPVWNGVSWSDDLAAGLYELRLELFDAAGALVNWTAKGIDLRVTDQDAPFGSVSLTTSAAAAYNRVLSGANTMGFRMVVRVDNNRCAADIQPVGGTVTPDPVCGFHNYNSPSDSVLLSFIARHPNNFAGYGFSTTRGPGPVIAEATTSGAVGDLGNNGFARIGAFNYSKNVVISTLLGSCSNAAFAERLDVWTLATDGYGRLSGYDQSDNAAFALATPCPDCGHGHHHP
ncbi:MAG TPA: hypothetical protein VJ775_07125 [Sphingomicrobium sp.]|nr:hypothetical protein [Sphingomicrobium sp.]